MIRNKWRIPKSVQENKINKAFYLDDEFNEWG